MPPTDCIVDAAVITIKMMNIDVVGGSPGGSPKPNTKTASPTKPHSPSPIPPMRTPSRIAMITTAPCSRINVVSIKPPPYRCANCRTLHRQHAVMATISARSSDLPGSDGAGEYRSGVQTLRCVDRRRTMTASAESEIERRASGARACGHVHLDVGRQRQHLRRGDPPAGDQRRRRRPAQHPAVGGDRLHARRRGVHRHLRCVGRRVRAPAHVHRRAAPVHRFLRAHRALRRAAPVSSSAGRSRVRPARPSSLVA